jgi:hypothetical protein
VGELVAMGDTVIDRFSQDLRREFPDNKGFSRAPFFLWKIKIL